MFPSLSLLSALLMGATTISAIDVIGFRTSPDCGVTGDPQSFNWGTMDKQCYTWHDDDGPKGMTTLFFNKMLENQCKGNSTSKVFIYSDTGCSNQMDEYAADFPSPCYTTVEDINGSPVPFFSFQHVCCPGVTENNCFPSD